MFVQLRVHICDLHYIDDSRIPPFCSKTPTHQWKIDIRKHVLAGSSGFLCWHRTGSIVRGGGELAVIIGKPNSTRRDTTASQCIYCVLNAECDNHVHRREYTPTK